MQRNAFSHELLMKKESCGDLEGLISPLTLNTLDEQIISWHEMILVMNQILEINFPKLRRAVKSYELLFSVRRKFET
jgi:hypothetical protein